MVQVVPREKFPVYPCVSPARPRNPILLRTSEASSRKKQNRSLPSSARRLNLLSVRSFCIESHLKLFQELAWITKMAATRRGGHLHFQVVWLLTFWFD